MVSSSRDQPFLQLLLIEEEPAVMNAATIFLCEEGYSVDTAETGEQGLLKAKRSHYHAILLSSRLAEYNGVSILNELRRHLPNSPVQLMTSRDASGDRSAEVRYAADTSLIKPYLMKPFTRTELVTCVKALVRPPSQETHRIIQIGCVSVDTESRKVTVDGTDVSLLTQEYNLLTLLASQRGAVVTRAEIYGQLFDIFDLTTPNLLDVYVSSLRRKIGSEVIKTRRGVGYTIDS